jgi:hypothetical protein
MKMRWAGVMALAAVSVVPSACMAQYRDYDYDGRHRRSAYRSTYDRGYDRGYEDGVRAGRVDGHRRERYSYRDERAYRRADAGYHRSYGSHSRYSSGYRSGFERGYRRAFDTERRAHRGRGHHCEYVGKSGTYGYDRHHDHAVEKDDRRY